MVDSVITYMRSHIRAHKVFILMAVAAAALYVYLAPHADLLGDASLNLSRALGWLDYFGPGQYSPLQWSGHTWWWSWLSFQDDPPLGFLIPHLFFTLFGDTALVAHIPYIIGFITSAFVTYWFVTRLEGKRVALLAAGIFLFSTFSVYTVLKGHLEGLEVPFIVGSFFSFVWYLKNRDVRFFYLGVLSTGLALSTKYTTLFLIPSFILLSLYRFVPREQSASPRVNAYFFALLVVIICSAFGKYLPLVVIGLWLSLILRMFQSKEKRYVIFLTLFTGFLFVSPYVTALIGVPTFLLLLLAPSIPLSSIGVFVKTNIRLYAKGLILALLILSPVIIYNTSLYLIHGAVDSSLAAILGTKNDLNRTPNFLIANGAWTALKSIFQSGSPLFTLYIAMGFLWLLYKNIRGKASLLEQATMVYSLLALLMISFTGGVERFTVILVPFIALSTALATRDLLIYTPRYLGITLIMLVFASEAFCMLNIIVLPQPVTTSPLWYSPQYLIQDDGYNELDAYIRTVMAPLPKRITPQLYADIPLDTAVTIPSTASRIILYDARFTWFESWWYLERYRIYYRLPVISTNALNTHPDILPEYPAGSESVHARAGTVLYYIYTEQQRPMSSRTNAQEDVFARTLDEQHVPYEVITNRAGIPEFRVYKLLL